MGNRKQPFGYRVVMGEIVIHPQEAELVEHIFRKYLIINIVFAFFQNNRPGIQLRNCEKILDKGFYSVKFLFRKISKFLNRREISSFFLQKSIVYI